MSSAGRPRRAEIGPAAAIFAASALIWSEHLLFGASRTDLGLFFAVVQLVVFLALFSLRFVREALRSIPLAGLAAGFAVVCFLFLLLSTPLGEAFAHPAWEQGVSGPAAPSLDPVASRIEAVKLAGLGAVFLIGAALGADDARARRMLTAVAVAGVLYALWALWDRVVAPDTVFGAPRAYHLNRLTASLESANTAATLFAALAVFGVARAAADLQGPAPFAAMTAAPLSLLLSLLSVGCLFLTASRGGFLACAAGLVAALTLAAAAEGRFASRKNVLKLAGGLVVMLGLMLLFSGPLAAKRWSGAESDLSSRGELFAVYWRMFLEAPFSGHGLGSLRWVTGLGIDPAATPEVAQVSAVHNVYLQWLVEGGLLLSLLMFLVVAFVGWRIVAGASRRRRGKAELAALFGVLVVFLVHGMMDFALQVPSMAAFLSLLLGLGYALSFPEDEKRRRLKRLSPAPAPPSGTPVRRPRAALR